jgi:putative hydrolase of the HAD superfamily
VERDDLARAEALARQRVNRWVRDGGRTSDAWRDYFRHLLHQVGVPAELHDEVILSLSEAHKRVGLWTVPIPGAVEAVAEVRRLGYRVGVVSNAEGRVEQDLRAAGFEGLLELVVDSHVVGVEKPDPGIFRIAVERMGVSPETTIFVGDVPAVDVTGARAAGIAPVLLDRHDMYPDADAPRLRAIEELPRWLAEGAS